MKNDELVRAADVSHEHHKSNIQNMKLVCSYTERKHLKQKRL